MNRRQQDDRDHYGNKRLDLAGPLMGGLFRQLFKKLTKDVKIYLQKVIISTKFPSLLFVVYPSSPFPLFNLGFISLFLLPYLNNRVSIADAISICRWPLKQRLSHKVRTQSSIWNIYNIYIVFLPNF